jgi:TolB protein
LESLGYSFCCSAADSRKHNSLLTLPKALKAAEFPLPSPPFGGGAPEDIAGVIASRSATYRQICASIPGSAADYSVTGQAQPGGSRGYVVQFQLSGAQGSQLLNLSFDVPANQLRPVAHRISDLIYEKITGERGLAGTRIAYVAGAGRFLVSRRRRCRRPKSPDDPALHNRSCRRPGRRMAPSWPMCRSRVADHRSWFRMSTTVVGGWCPLLPASMALPSWSPDGRRLAFTLSKDGNPEIYALDLAAKPGSPDQQRNYRYRAGLATGWQYRVHLGSGRLAAVVPDRLRGGAAQRLTFEGDYNARPRFRRMVAISPWFIGAAAVSISPRWILQTRQFRVLTAGGLDESPSFAPNGKMIIYSNGQRLAAVSVDGSIKQDFALRGNGRDPVWAPYSR